MLTSFLQVPNYQKPRVHIPGNNNFINTSDHGGQHSGPPDRTRQTSGNVPNTVQMNSGEVMNVQFDGKRMRKAVVRKTVDYNTSVIKYLEVCTD